MQLWIGVHLPHLALESFLPRWSTPRNEAEFVVLENDRVVALDRAAHPAGIVPGMRRGGVLTLVPDAVIRERDLTREAELVRDVAFALLQFTPPRGAGRGIGRAGRRLGEADQLRRAMAAWRRKGELEAYYDRIVNGMLERGYDREFAEAIFAQIQGFGEYGLPESHAASFALLVYASAWLRRHEPVAFLVAMLNSQPMGFYSPSQLVQDAKRHGVKVLPVDVTLSNWDSAVEGQTTSSPVRVGMSLVRGLKEEAAARIELARAVRPFIDVSDLARRAQLDRTDLQVLAAADALRSLAGDRRAALWYAVAAVPDRDLLRGATDDDATPVLAPMTEGQQIASDYRTLGRHPLELLRPRLLAQRLLPASTLAGLRNGQLARACGIVTVRQRPGTAKDVMFVTLEDETGQVNVIIWPSLLEKQRREVLGSSLLAVYGVWQREGEVRHLVAHRLVDVSALLGSLVTSTRNFH